MLDNEEKTNKVRVTEMHMSHWMSGLTIKNRIRNNYIRDNLKMVPIDDKMGETHVSWFGRASKRL